MSIEIITLLMFGTLLLLIFSGLGIAWCLGATAVIFCITMWGPASLPILAQRVFDSGNNFILLACPMFTFMAFCLEESGMAEDLFNALHKWSGKVNGGIAVATIFICAILAACTGITATATVAMAVIAYPNMMQHGYNSRLGVGVIASSGGLGILIPPSVPMVLLAMAGGQSLGQLFIGGTAAGVFIALAFSAYVLILGLVKPEYCPAATEIYSWKEKIVALKTLIVPGIIIFLVLGLLMIGLTTPTEASAVGAISSLIYLMSKKKKFNRDAMKRIFHKTTIVTGMAFWIVFGATSFTAVFNALGSQDLVANMVTGINISPWAIIAIFCAILFILGMFLDPIGVIMIAGPVMTPIVAKIGFNPTWFGVIFIILIQIGYISPPFGYNLFYMKAAQPHLEMKDIFAGVLPFIAVMVFSVILMCIFPDIIMWLPKMLAPA